MKNLWTVAIPLCLVFASALAGQPSTALPPNVFIHKITYETFHERYETVGGTKSVPKLFVFSPAAMCVGLAVGDASHPEHIYAFIKDSLTRDKKACDTKPFSQAQDARPANHAAKHRPEVDLVVFDMPFCEGCNDYKAALLEAARGSLANTEINFLEVELGALK